MGYKFFFGSEQEGRMGYKFFLEVSRWGWYGKFFFFLKVSRWCENGRECAEGEKETICDTFFANVNRGEVARYMWRREHMGDREICFFCSHYRVKNNNYTTVICRGIILEGAIQVHPCGRGKSTVCDA